MGQKRQACNLKTEAIQLEISLIRPELSPQQWIDWLEEEKGLVRHRFGYDDEAKQYFPDDYYDRMIEWWKTQQFSNVDPITVYYDDKGVVQIEDGSHRLAISHLLKWETVPVVFSDDPPKE